MNSLLEKSEFLKIIQVGIEDVNIYGINWDDY